MVTSIAIPAKSIWSYNPYPSGCELYLPLWHPSLRSDSIRSIDRNRHLCDVTGAVWGATGRTFDNSDDVISVPDAASLDLTTAGTIIAWGYPTSLTDVAGTHYNCILDKEDLLNNQNGYCFYFLSYSFFLEVAHATGYQRVGGTANLFANNNWYCVAGTWDSSNMYLYTNGVQDTTAAQTVVPVANAYPIQIGKGNTYTPTAYGGVTGEVWVYNRALTAGEIQYIYDKTRRRYS